MDFFDLLTMIGGLAFFLYGMHLLGDGLARIAGGRFENILKRLTGNPLKAVLMGAGVTAVIQSSSAATVMVVGFVNSGMMRLEQAAGVIMGANVGTTITSWILGAQGIDSSSFLVRLCKPASFSPVLAIAGLGLMNAKGRTTSRRDRRQSIGVAMIGFAILMFGMDTMSGAVKPLADVPEFTGILTRFTNPLLGVLAGTALTAVLQSSSASVGILQAFCAAGAVEYRAAVPIIMGQNIGTCVTAMLSGVGAGRNAKRAALIHLYFNLIGTALFLAFFYAVNAVRPFAFLGDAATPFGIAAVHSVFNLLSTVCLLPFTGGLVRLACLSIREETDRRETEQSGEDEDSSNVGGIREDMCAWEGAYAGEDLSVRGRACTEAGQDSRERKSTGLLDFRFLEMPSYAVERSRTVAVLMAELSERTMILATGLLESYSGEAAEEVSRLERRVDVLEDELGSYLLKLGVRELPERDSHTVAILLHCIGDFERISDHAVNISEAVEEMEEKGLRFSEKAKDELAVFSRAVRDILELSMRSFREENLLLAGQVEPLEEVVDGLNQEIRRRHIKRLRKGKCTIELGFLLSDIMMNLERVSDHCSNIAVCLLEVSENEFETHAYLDRLRQADNIDFRGRVMAYEERYRLP